jgi:hypothetical protein
MNIEKKALNTSDKTGNEEEESIFPKRMIFFILVLSAVLMTLILFSV